VPFQTRAGILVSLDLPCQAKDEMDPLHFVGSRKTRRKSALATTESALRRSAPGPWVFGLDKHHIAWMELGQNGSFWGDALYEVRKVGSQA
jgi:hypothetical protein